MNLKRLILAVVILGLLSAMVFIARRPSAPAVADVRVGKALLPAGIVDPAAQVTVKDEGKMVELSRSAAGEWTVKNFFDLPADFQKLARLTGDLSDAKITRFVTSNGERLSRLDFKDTSVELRDSAGKPLWTAFLGKTADTGGRFVKFGGEQKAYLANWSGYLDAEPKNWADAQLLNLKPEDVSKISLQLPSGPIAISRAKKDAPWSADPAAPGQQLDTDKVNSLLTSLGSLRFSEATDPAAPDAVAAKQAERTYTLTTFDNKTYAISLGRKPEEKKLKISAPETGGPAALGTSASASADQPTPTPGVSPTPKPLTPEFETIPAGPVYVWIKSSDTNARVNAIMAKRAFQIPEYTFTGLPQKAEDLFKAPPTPTAAAAPSGMPVTPSGPPDSAKLPPATSPIPTSGPTPSPGT